MANYLIFNQNGSGLGDTEKILVNRDHIKYVSYIAANQLGLKLNSGSLITIQLTGNEAPAVIDSINEVLKANPSGKELKVTLPAGITIDPSGTTIAGGGGGAESLNDLTDASTVKGGASGSGYTQNLILGQVALNLPNLNTQNSAGRNVILIPTADANPTNFTDGTTNVIIGHNATSQLTTGSFNVAIGNAALFDCTDGRRNVAVGTNTLSNVNASGNGDNVGIGASAGRNATSGTGNTFVGALTDFPTGARDGSNVTLIGNQAQCSSTSVSNEITLGNSSVTALRCAVTSITSLSDERDKKDITDLEYGLDFIESLQPKQFTWDNRPETMVEIDEDGNEIEKEIENANKGKKDFGFIAQDVQPLDNDVLRLVYDENPDKLEMSYGKLVPILVKAVKELSEKVKALEAN